MTLNMPFSRLFLLLCATASVVNASFELKCTEPLVQERLDPVGGPGQLPAGHVHTVYGGSNFAPNSTYETLRASQCTSCNIAEDLSTYWYPKLYFRDPKTKKFESVKTGGFVSHYLNSGDVEGGLKAFPPGFKMISGDYTLRSRKNPTRDSSQASLAEQATRWSCQRSSDNSYDSYTVDDNLMGFPSTNCESGFKAFLYFPSCWDGENVDSENHKSHLAFLDGLDKGKCPETHPVGLIQLLFEVTWDVNAFADRWNEESDSWPFVYADGDPTGYSWHGDFQNGWDTDVLQKAIDECSNSDEECEALTFLPSSQFTQCKIEPVVNESVGLDGKALRRLPGCNPIQRGPENATPYTDDNCPRKCARKTKRTLY